MKTYEAARTYAILMDQFRNRPTPALMKAAQDIAALPISDATTTALDMALFLLAERMDLAGFELFLENIEKTS